MFAEVFDPPGPVVEVGSFYLPGYQWLSDLRPYFKGGSYTGCDLRRGPGVDRIENAEALSFADRSVGTMLLFEILEHLPRPYRAISEARRVLREDGLMALSVPFDYRLHGFPNDYWRFTASGIHTLLSEFPEKVIFALGPELKPAFIFAAAAKNVSPTFAEKKGRFLAEIQKTFQDSRHRGYMSVLKSRGRDLFGFLLGRANLGVRVFVPSKAYYEQESAPRQQI